MVRLQQRVVGSRRAVVVLASVLVASVLVFVLYLGPVLLVRGQSPLTAAERLKAENDVRTTLLQAIAGAILLAGLYFTGRTFQLNREGQVTERFTRAIDQLGNENQDIRIGGIYALERIAQSSHRDHAIIVEVLTAFIREHQSWRADEAPNSGTAPSEEATVDSSNRRADVQAILRVLGRRRREWDGDERLDLSGSDLRGFGLVGAHLEDADLQAAHLEDADLSDAHLQHANLVEAHLEGSLIQGTQLVEANLNRANLERAYLNGADLRGANLDGARLTGAYLGLVNLAGASLSSAPLRGAVLQDVDLRETWLSAYHLDGAWIDERTQLPALEPFEGRIWVADHIRGKLIAVVRPGETPPSTSELEEFRYESAEFRDATDSFKFEDTAPEPTPP